MPSPPEGYINALNEIQQKLLGELPIIGEQLEQLSDEEITILDR